MKKYKNVSLSILFYLLAIIWFITSIYIGNILLQKSISLPVSSEVANKIDLAVLFILLLLSIYFGIKSNKKKESLWAGNLLAVVGIITIIVYFLLMSGLMI